MWGTRYFNARFWGSRFWSATGAAVSVASQIEFIALLAVSGAITLTAVTDHPELCATAQEHVLRAAAKEA